MSQFLRNLADREHAAKHFGLYSVQLGAKRKNPYNHEYQGVTRDIIKAFDLEQVPVMLHVNIHSSK